MLSKKNKLGVFIDDNDENGFISNPNSIVIYNTNNLKERLLYRIVNNNEYCIFLKKKYELKEE